jgi:hypothetical protein
MRNADNRLSGSSTGLDEEGGEPIYKQDQHQLSSGAFGFPDKAIHQTA